MAAVSWHTELKNGFAIGDSTGLAFVAWRLVVPHPLVLFTLRAEVFMHFVITIRRHAAFEVCPSLAIPIALVYLTFFSQPDSNLSKCHVRVGVWASPSSWYALHLFRLLLIFSPATGVPDMRSLRTGFRSIESTQHGPYFRGYCGEHESEYQGTTQLAGTPLCRLLISFIDVLTSQSF